MRDREHPPVPEDEPYDLEDDGAGDDQVVPELIAPALPEFEDVPVIDIGDAPPIAPSRLPSAPGAPSVLDPRALIHALDPTRDWRSLSDEKERERVIAEVMRDQVRREVLREVAYRPRGASLRLRIAAAVLVAAALVVWFLPIPGFRARIPFPLPPAEEAARLQLATWVQAQQVEAFRQQRGRLPDVLRELGETLPGMTYERLDAETYRLSGSTERTAFTWLSTDTLDARTRAAADRLRGPRP